MQSFSFLNSTLSMLLVCLCHHIIQFTHTHTFSLMQITKMKTLETVRCCDCCFNGSIVVTVKSWKCTTDFHKSSYILYQSLVHFLSHSPVKSLFCSLSIHFIKLEIAYIEGEKNSLIYCLVLVDLIERTVINLKCSNFC